MIRKLAPAVRNQIDRTLQRAGLSFGTQVRSGNRAAPQDKDGGFEWVLSTEQPVVVWDWDQYDFVREILLVDGMEAPDQVPLLDSHVRFSVDDVLGSVNGFGRAEVGSFAAATGMVWFAADEKSQRTRQKVEDNHLTDGSVGYVVNERVWVPDGEKALIGGRSFEGPVKIALDWTLKEFSATPIGADTFAKVRSLRNGAV